ncbi:MAG: UDP-N-acetylglucosamine--N-acetylmuramyl-(pentapeptide) pyrophosphoryl-undecaprenol N-acetylglucosamine transferase [Chloroflexota bacterium]|nr:MAG: UDP-N-acetylglucosamine--N-acetylmuramyl-(pentapeptide) pyrophosphoryl-undecaprenol N-acetylglucosamine transferase [Chloroflexota bacterium]
MSSEALFIAAGGTGGGIYPALSVVEALRARAPQLALYFIGSKAGIENALVPRQGWAGFHSVQSGALHGVGRLKQLGSSLKIAMGTWQAWRLASRYRPRALFLTGGWATFPTALGCWLRGVPILVYVPDIEPALGVRVISRFARLVLTPVPESAAYFRRGVRVEAVGYPLRRALLSADRLTAQARFQLDPERQTLLVFGGSLGARSLNNALSAILPELLADGLQVLHISGQADWEAVQARRAALDSAAQARYHAFAYLHDEMGLALAAADLVVCRAGASVLGELTHFALPSILVPYPHAWRYQKVNADWLVARGAALRLDDAHLMSHLLPTVRALLSDPGRLEAMRQAARRAAVPNAAQRIAERLLELAKLTQSLERISGE